MSGIGKNKSGKSGCSKLIDENGLQYENMKAAEFLNNYYVYVGPTLANKLPGEWDRSKCKIEVNSTFNFS